MEDASTPRSAPRWVSALVRTLLLSWMVRSLVRPAPAGDSASAGAQPPPAPPAEGRPAPGAHPIRWLALAVGALTCDKALKSIGTLLQQVQQSGSDLFGGMESLGRGLLPVTAVERTQSLLKVWHESFVITPAVRQTILTTSVLYTVADVLFILCYLWLLAGIGRWLARLPSDPAVAPAARWELFQRLARSRAAVRLPFLAAAADLAEDGLRLGLISHTFGSGDGSAPTWVVASVWIVTSAKFLLIGLTIVVLLLLVRDRGIARGHWGALGWALWRLRVPAGATLVFVALLLGDPTGQAADLVRRWIDTWRDAGTGAGAVLGAMLLGLTVWLITRRIVLADQGIDERRRRGQEVVMTLVWLAVALIVTLIALRALDWHVDRNTLIILGVAVAILLAALFLPGHPARGRVARIATDWRTILLIAAVAAWVVAAAAGWGELRAPATVATAILVLEVFAFIGRRHFRRSDEAGPTPSAEPPLGRMAAARAESARREWERDVRQPTLAKVRIVRRSARLLAVAAPIALLVTAAGAFAPVPLVLHLSHSVDGRRFFYAVTVAIVTLLAPAALAVGGYLGLRALDGREPATEQEHGPRALEWRYGISIPIILLAAALVLVGGAAHWRGVGPLCVVAAFLAIAIIVLGEAQLRSETHGAPASFLLAGFTRVPPVTLIVLTALIAGFAFSDGSGHQVFKTGALPAALAPRGQREGVDLTVAFQEWVTKNCADEHRPDSAVPLLLVSAPGGGLRAAYWTASTLSDLLGPAATPAGTPAPGCPAAAPSDRVFAVGGASGGSLGELAWIAGLNDTQPRGRTWYDTQLAGPDFLTDPLAWLLTVDIVRGYLGFHGQDRARRLENRWSQAMPGLRGDFLAASWGAGGDLPLPMLTSTQVETGCRLNVSGLRVTDAIVHEQESSCTTVHDGFGQSDAPAVSDLLDYLCGPRRGSDPASLSRSTAALLSARFPWVSPSGQLDRCAGADPAHADATRISVVDGGYADNTGIGLLLDMWPRLEQLIDEHNAAGGQARIVPVFLEIDNHYAAVAAPATPGRTAETLVPPLTRNRPDQLDDLTMRARVEAVFTGPVPGTATGCWVDPIAGRYVRISPKISPGLPAPLAWTLSEAATEDLRSQRAKALADPGPRSLKDFIAGATPAGC